MLRTLALLAAAAAGGLAATVEREWSIEWVNAAPDGHSRPVIGVYLALLGFLEFVYSW